MPYPCAAARGHNFGGPSFSPLSIPGLKLWLKADAGTYTNAGATVPAADMDPVRVWVDQSGQGNNVTQGTSSNRPGLRLNSLNGKPILRFDGVNDFLISASFSLVQPFTVFSVLKLNLPAISVKVAWSSSLAGGGPYIETSTTDEVKTFAGFLEIPFTVPTAGTSIVMLVPSGVSTKARVNGGDEFTLSGNPGANNASGLTLAADGGGAGGYCSCDFAEILMIAGEPTLADKNSVFTYLNSRWAIY